MVLLTHFCLPNILRNKTGMINKLLALLGIVSVMATSCTSNEIGDSKDVAQDKIYQEFSVNYKEADDKINLTAVFRFAGPNGTTLVLNKPSNVKLDDELLKVDSTDLRGAYYDAKKIPAQWMGKHVWRFTNINNKVYENEFSFDAFKWGDVSLWAKKSEPLKLYFITTELGVDDYIEISTIESDSSFSFTQGPLNTKPFMVTIPVEYLQKQKQATLKLEAVRVQKIKLQYNTAEGGELIIRYSLQPVIFQLK